MTSLLLEERKLRVSEERAKCLLESLPPPSKTAFVESDTMQLCEWKMAKEDANLKGWWDFKK